MAILIDGYNLLHAAGIIPAGSEQGSLESARRALFDFLIGSLTADERQQTTIVFDARKAPPGLPHRLTVGGLQILFAHDHDEADDLIEELIRTDHVPRKLVVVSSDHRIQRAAKRRRAKSIDSDKWYWQICERRDQERTDVTAIAEQSKPDAPLGNEELAMWLIAFGDVDEADADLPVVRSTSSQDDSDVDDTSGTDNIPNNDVDKSTVMENPFPPGYGEDLLTDEDDTGDIFPPGYGEDLLDEDG